MGVSGTARVDSSQVMRLRAVSDTVATTGEGGMRCPRCGSLNPVGAAFCGACGVRMPGQDGAAFPAPTTVGQPRRPSLFDSDSTRYLCAAVHLDSVLAERLIRDIVDED
jgi:hypothetical protein